MINFVNQTKGWTNVFVLTVPLKLNVTKIGIYHHIIVQKLLQFQRHIKN